MPNIIVLFELKPTPEGRARYLELAAMLKPLLSGFEGFIRAERFESLADHSKLLSMNVWTDEAAVSRWRNTLKHRLAQREGLSLPHAHLRICRSTGSRREKDATN